MQPFLSDDLLPTTFRNLVMNDIVDQLGYPITEFINNPQNGAYFNELSTFDMDELLEFAQRNPIDSLLGGLENGDPAAVKELENLRNLRWRPGLQGLFSRPEWIWADELVKWADRNPFIYDFIAAAPGYHGGAARAAFVAMEPHAGGNPALVAAAGSIPTNALQSWNDLKENIGRKGASQPERSDKHVSAVHEIPPSEAPVPAVGNL